MTLPLLQTDVTNERYHRNLIANTVNQLIKVRPPFDKTEAEITADVTPLDYGYAPGHLSRYANDWLSAFKVASAGNVKVQVPGGAYSIAAEIDHTGDVEVECLGPVTITCTNTSSTIRSLFRITGKLKWYGARTSFDGDDATFLAFHCPTVLPEVEDITFSNFLSAACMFGRAFSGASANSYSGATGTGHGYAKNCVFENCGISVFAYGTGKTSETSFQLIDCNTDADCGNISNLFSLSELGYGLARGGWYRGVSTTAPNMTRTGRCEYIGGRYENMLRGPTTGEESDFITIVGGISSGMSFSGVSVDARIGSDDSVPYVTGKVDWTVEGVPGHGVFCQASGLDINVRYIGDGTATGSENVVRLTDALDVALGRITAYNHGAGVLISLGAGAAPVPGSSAYKTGEWRSDSTNGSPIRCTSSASTLYMGAIRTVNSNADLNFLDEIVLVDASGGVVDIDCPAASSAENIIGKRWRIKVIDSTNNVTITRDGGGATSINGGASFTITAGANYREVIIESIGGANYIVAVSV